MTTATSPAKHKAFLDGFCARLLAAACLVAAVALVVHLNRAELFADQAGQKVSGIFPAFTSCRDEEYERLAKMAADAPEKWSAEAIVKAKQAANAMCIKKTASESGAN